jgi:hypothetical protein
MGHWSGSKLQSAILNHTDSCNPLSQSQVRLPPFRQTTIRLATACVFAFVCLATTSAIADTAEWTLMVFMNAKNNLEADALANFREIAIVGSIPKVNVVVELGRP